MKFTSGQPRNGSCLLKAFSPLKQVWVLEAPILSIFTFYKGKYSEKRTKEVQRQLERAQQKQEAKMREAKKNMNDSELEHYKEQVETLKRLAAEKEALLIQKSINEVRDLKSSKRSSSSRGHTKTGKLAFRQGFQLDV